MTTEEIKVEFGRHSPDAPIMRAFRSWLRLLREDAADSVSAGNTVPHIEHRHAGMLQQTSYQLTVFDEVLEEARRTREEADRVAH